MFNGCIFLCESPNNKSDVSPTHNKPGEVLDLDPVVVWYVMHGSYIPS